MEPITKSMLHRKAPDVRSDGIPRKQILSFDDTDHQYQMTLSTLRADTPPVLHPGPALCYIVEGVALLSRNSTPSHTESIFLQEGEIIHVPAHETFALSPSGQEPATILEVIAPADTSPQFRHILKTEGTSLAVMTDIGIFKVGAEETDRSYIIMEWLVPPSGGPAMHTQTGVETFYILEGNFTFHGRHSGQSYTLLAGAGDVIHIPNRVAHTYQNTTEKTGKLLVIMAPAGRAQEFFERIGVPVTDTSVFPRVPVLPPDPASFLALLKEYQIGVFDA